MVCGEARALQSAHVPLKLDGIAGQRKGKLVVTKGVASAAERLCRGSGRGHLRKYPVGKRYTDCRPGWK